jgi:hypothetical protein
VLLGAVHIAVTGIARHDFARYDDFDRAAKRIVDDANSVCRHSVKRRDLLGRERPGLHRPPIVGVVPENDIERETPRAGVLAAHDLRKSCNFIGDPAVKDMGRMRDGAQACSTVSASIA